MQKPSKQMKLRRQGSFAQVFASSTDSPSTDAEKQLVRRSRPKQHKPILSLPTAQSLTTATTKALQKEGHPGVNGSKTPRRPKLRRRYSATQVCPSNPVPKARHLLQKEPVQKKAKQPSERRRPREVRGKIRDIRLRCGASLQTIKTVDEDKERSEDSQEANKEESKDKTPVRSKVDVNRPVVSKHEAQNSSENALRRRISERRITESSAFQTKRDLEQKMARIRKNWDIVRAIGRAATSLHIMSWHAQQGDDSKCGIKGYSRFRRIMRVPPSKRSARDQRFLVEATAELPFFKGEDRHSNHVTSSQQMELCRVMNYETFPQEGTVVFEQGEESRSFYIIVEGSVSVSVFVEQDAQPQQVALLTKGMTFGENAINRSEAFRSATVTTEEPSSFITISKEDYTRILCAPSATEAEEIAQRLANVGAFEGLSPCTLRRLAGLAKTKKYGLHEKVATQGTPVDQSSVLTVVKRGEVIVQRAVQARSGKRGHGKGRNGSAGCATSPWSMCVVGHSEILTGEPKFMQQTRHTCSFVANTLVEVYTFSKHNLFSNLSEEELQQIESNIQPFPPLKYTQILFEASMRWQQYKQLLTENIAKGPAKKWTHEQVLKQACSSVGGPGSEDSYFPACALEDNLMENFDDFQAVEEFCMFSQQFNRQVYRSSFNHGALHFLKARYFLHPRHANRDTKPIQAGTLSQDEQSIMPAEADEMR